MLRKVLVTGGAGYVGCVLVRRLLTAGYFVWVYDVIYFGREGLPAETPGLEVIKGDGIPPGWPARRKKIFVKDYRHEFHAAACRLRADWDSKDGR